MKKLKRTLAILCVAALVLSLSACGNRVSTNEFEWPTTGLATMLPEPTTLRGEITKDDDSEFFADISKITEEDYKEYVEACKDKGFTVDAEEGDTRYHAFNEDGYILGLHYNSDKDYFEIDLDEPWFEAGETFSWPTIGLATLLPEPATNVGKISDDSSKSFSVYVGESSIDDYNNYIDACIAAGFTVNYDRSEKDFDAKNEAGVSLSVSYEGFNTFYIDITAYGVDLESLNGEVAEENIEEESAEEDTGEEAVEEDTQEEKEEEIVDNTATQGAEEEPAQAKEESEPTATVGENNALQAAKRYLKVSHYSYSGLVDQLKFEGYTDEEAAYGADNCGADWNEQAILKGQDYLNISAYSRDGLINQLEFEGFSEEEATNAADNCGADWNEQAALKAQEYLNLMSYSKEALINQLEFEGFTAEQAAYGASAVMG